MSFNALIDKRSGYLYLLLRQSGVTYLWIPSCPDVDLQYQIRNRYCDAQADERWHGTRRRQDLSKGFGVLGKLGQDGLNRW